MGGRFRLFRLGGRISSYRPEAYCVVGSFETESTFTISSSGNSSVLSFPGYCCLTSLWSWGQSACWVWMDLVQSTFAPHKINLNQWMPEKLVETSSIQWFIKWSWIVWIDFRKFCGIVLFRAATEHKKMTLESDWYCGWWYFIFIRRDLFDGLALLVGFAKVRKYGVKLKLMGKKQTSNMEILYLGNTWESFHNVS